MGETKTYAGGCHCGKVRYEATTDLAQVITCNCSHCSMRAPILTFVPPEQFKLVCGDEAELGDYQFNKKNIHHLFCQQCGVESFAWGTGPSGKMYALNVRCLEGVDVSALSPMQVDGKSR
ncbi:GFA family protein [Labilithrix luteola]|nr:GFA family protein [Labilithrix luteola]